VTRELALLQTASNQKMDKEKVLRRTMTTNRIKSGVFGIEEVHSLDKPVGRQPMKSLLIGRDEGIKITEKEEIRKMKLLRFEEILSRVEAKMDSLVRNGLLTMKKGIKPVKGKEEIRGLKDPRFEEMLSRVKMDSLVRSSLLIGSLTGITMMMMMEKEKEKEEIRDLKDPRFEEMISRVEVKGARMDKGHQVDEVVRVVRAVKDSMEGMAVEMATMVGITGRVGLLGDRDRDRASRMARRMVGHRW